PRPRMVPTASTRTRLKKTASRSNKSAGTRNRLVRMTLRDGALAAGCPSSCATARAAGVMPNAATSASAASRPFAIAQARRIAPTNTRAAYTTTYSRMTTPKSKPPDPDTLEWTRFYIETEYQNETSFGAIEEAQYAIDRDEIVLADIDGRYSLRTSS